jgi:hypothetical protein
MYSISYWCCFPFSSSIYIPNSLVRIWKALSLVISVILTCVVLYLEYASLLDIPTIPFCKELTTRLCNDIFFSLLIGILGIVVSINSVLGLYLASISGKEGYGSVRASASTKLSNYLLDEKKTKFVSSHCDPSLVAANHFNRKPLKGIEYFVRSGLIENYIPPNTSIVFI